MYPILFRIGGFPLGTYGVLVSIAIGSAVALAMWQGKKDRLDSFALFDLVMVVLVAGILGTRIALVVVDLSRGESLAMALQHFSFRAGGVIHGGIILGVAAFFWRMQKHHLPIAYTGDAFAAAIPLGQAIGRLGCFAAGCCYGSESNQPWAVTFHSVEAHARCGTPLGTPLHPIQLYIFFFDISVAIVLILMRPKRRFPAQLAAAYFMLEGIGRIVLETWRADSTRGVGLFGLNWLSSGRLSGFLLLAFGSVVWMWFGSKSRIANSPAT